jgi:hypothetical protein
MSSHPPSAVVLIIDQITATMLGPYGNTQYDTPNFNRLAARSLLYDFAFANSSDLISAYHHFWQPSFKTHPDESSLPAILSHAGIESVLVTDESGIAEHQLAEFDRVISLQQSPADKAAESAAETQLAGFFAQATATLTELTPGTFCWLHSRGLRGAWDAPYSYRIHHAEDDDPDPPTFVESPSKWLDPAVVDPDELLGIQQAASGQIVLLDEFLGVFMDLMDSQPSWRSTLFCLAAPRGCALGEHGLVGTGAQLFNESVQVPLLICAPESVAKTKGISLAAIRSSKLVQVNLLTKLVTDWLTEELDFLQTRLAAVGSVLPEKKTEYILITSNEQESLQTHAWKLIRSKMGGVQLFAKPDDRCDVNDVSDRCPDTVRKMLVLMEHLLEHESVSGDCRVDLSDDLAFGVG